MSLLDLFLHDLDQAKKKRAEGVDVEAAKPHHQTVESEGPPTLNSLTPEGMSWKNWLELLCVFYLLPVIFLQFSNAEYTELGRIYMNGLFICLIILFILSRDEDYRPRSLFMKPKDEESEAEERFAKKNSEKLSPKERQALMSRKCSVPGCNTGNFRMTDYCHKHQDHISSNSEPETEEEENWWEDEN